MELVTLVRERLTDALPAAAAAVQPYLPLIATSSVVLWAVYKTLRFWRSDCDASVEAALHRLPPEGGFKNDVILITGASSGIGEALAYQLAEGGATLILAARRVDRLLKVAERCHELGAPEAMALKLDVLDTASIEPIVQTLIKKFGRIDVLVNNAGRSQRGLAENTPLSVDRDLFDVNVFGVLALTHAVLPRMLAAGKGTIMNTSSAAGKVGSPCSATYSATKAAINSYFDAVRMECAYRGIHVINVCPGPVKSEITMHAFTESAGEEHGKPTEDSIKRVTAGACELLFTAIIIMCEKGGSSSRTRVKPCASSGVSQLCHTATQSV